MYTQAIGVSHTEGAGLRLERARLGVGQHVSRAPVSRPGASSPLTHSLTHFSWMQVDAVVHHLTLEPPEIKRHKGFAGAPGLHWTSMWWAHQDSNLKPRDYESPALTVEL